ncbi:DNA-deoxyinosine glycosylase [Clostridium thailandense]|uniref:DNA-deoxyinosine glycosylase n=1 Tax=Clostridium thailandense TaxID=2794346 RepID=UPI00398A307F
MENIRSFKPIIDNNSKILILGSIPGVESLNKQQYYAHKRNQFWKIIFSLYELSPSESYEKKIKFLKSKGIALWDVIDCCFREGSLDSDIKNELPNDFTSLFEKHPNIRCVLFNGSKSYEIFKKKIGFENFKSIEFHKLPSTSAAHAIPFESKMNEWKIIKNYLE